MKTAPGAQNQHRSADRCQFVPVPVNWPTFGHASQSRERRESGALVPRRSAAEESALGARGGRADGPAMRQQREEGPGGTGWEGIAYAKRQ